VNEDVLCFDVSVDKRVLVEDFIALAELFKEEPYFLFGNEVLVIKEILFEVPSVAILHDEVEVIFAGDLYFFVVDEVGMVGKLLQNQQLSLAYVVVLFFLQGNYLAGQVFLKVFSVVGLHDCSRGSLARDVLLNGVRRPFQFLNSDLFAHKLG
jgi:hypothetical protein